MQYRAWTVFFWGGWGYQKFTVAHHLFSLLCNMSHVKSTSKPDNSKPKSLPPLTVYYTNVGGLGEIPQILKHLCSRTTLPSLFPVKPTCMTTSRTLISNCLATCQSIARMLGICTALVFMLRAIFRLLERLFLRKKTSLMCFRLALLHSTISYFSCIVRHLRHLVLCHPI